MDLPSPKSFTNAMRALVGNCSVITAGEGEDRSGLLVTSAISLSADRKFGWSSLGADHQKVAENFSGFGGVKGADRYNGATWETAETGALLLEGAPAAFDCELEEMIDRATHSIVIGRVRAIRHNVAAGALVYWNGAFKKLHPEWELSDSKKRSGPEETSGRYFLHA